MSRLERSVRNRQLIAFLSRFAALLAGASVQPAFAQQMVGQSLLNFAATYIVAPLGIFAIVGALAASLFRPDMAKGALYAAIICAVVFFIIKMAPQLMSALQN